MAQAFQLLTLFARREPTADRVAIQQGLAHKEDVVLYEDRECTKPKGRYSWDRSGRPRRNSKTVMLNCFRWNLQWVH